MERTDAERVFALIADLNGDLRDRILAERWWLIWIAMGVEMLATCLATHRLITGGETRLSRFVALWAVHVALIPVIIAVIHRRAGGQRTAAEGYLWWIWATYIGCASALALANALLGLPVFFTAPVLALLAAFAFSVMAMVTHRFFLLGTAYFLAVMAAMAAFRGYQFLLFGGAWFVLLVGIGLYFRATDHPRTAERL